MFQGSVLAPLLFTLYTADVVNIIRAQQLLHHCYADDVQALGSSQLDEREALKANVVKYIQSTTTWMASNRLILNAIRSEYVLRVCSTSIGLQRLGAEYFPSS